MSVCHMGLFVICRFVTVRHGSQVGSSVVKGWLRGGQGISRGSLAVKSGQEGGQGESIFFKRLLPFRADVLRLTSQQSNRFSKYRQCVFDYTWSF